MIGGDSRTEAERAILGHGLETFEPLRFQEMAEALTCATELVRHLVDGRGAIDTSRMSDAYVEKLSRLVVALRRARFLPVDIVKINRRPS